MIGLLILVVGLGLLSAVGAAGSKVLARVRQREAKLADRLAGLRPPVDGVVASGVMFGPDSGPRFLRVRFARADIQITAKTVYAAVAAAAALAMVIAWLNQPVLALAAVALAFAGAVGALEVVAARNTAGLVRELPFLLDGVRQHLTVGASLQQALIRGVDNAGPAIRRSFLPMIRRIQNGSTVVEALVWLAERIETPEIDMLLVAVQTNTRFGGGMSPTLSHLSQILRDRTRVARELKGATAETRFSGWILAGLPILAMVGIAFMNPPYTIFLFETDLGRRMLAFAFGAQALGCFFMSRVMRLDF